jgi:CRISPR/Cas system-associated exonuclease Cas4 (RecB family)
LNVYKVIAEENKEKPTKINQLFVINIGVMNGAMEVQEVPIWPSKETKLFIENTVKEINNHVENKIPPNVDYKSKGWMCDQCQYTDLCKRDTQSIIGSQSRLAMSQEAKESEGVSVRVRKK